MMIQLFWRDVLSTCRCVVTNQRVSRIVTCRGVCSDQQPRCVLKPSSTHLTPPYVLRGQTLAGSNDVAAVA